MAVISVTAAQVSAVKCFHSDTYTANATITPGQPCALDSTGKVVLAKADAATTMIVEGISLGSALPGQGVTLLKRGIMTGFTLGTSLLYGTQMLWLSAGTAGLIEDAQAGAGNYKVPLGRVIALSDYQQTRLFEVSIDKTHTYGTAAITNI